MMRDRGYRVARTLAVLAAVALTSSGAVSTSPADATAHFLERHWAHPIAPQGTPPARFSALEASLDPASCGQCHARQLEDWQSSLHARSMGPGILWQFHLMGQKAANECLQCHAPLAEQKSLLAMERGWAHAPATPPPRYIPPDLHRGGLVCAACHVRRHARFGPPPRDGAARAPDASLPHGGFSATAAFQDSRFCSTCHQFPPDGPRLNGKLLENTYEEWTKSPAAKRGQSCQSCHMSDRRHLWRGIHDRAMTREALEISLEVGHRGRGETWARARLANVGAGHYFPTYVVPEVVAVLALVDSQGSIRSELKRHVIGRRVDLRLSEEISDTRIAPGGHAVLEAAFASPPAKDWRVELRVSVRPARHYERVFRDALERPLRLSPEAHALLRQALAQAEASGYELDRLSKPLPGRRAPR
jgi:hypothetical protein